MPGRPWHNRGMSRSRSRVVDWCESIARHAGGWAALVALALLLPGLRASVRPGGRVVGRPERVLSPGRLALVSVAWFAAVALAWRRLPIVLRPGQRLLLLATSLPLYLIGMVGIASGRLALGGSYRVSTTAGLRLAPDHHLVTSGPYAVVRHPMYVGMMLAALSALLLYRTWTTLLVVAQLPVLVARARLEDRALAVAFGAAWEAYRDRVPGWIPTWSRPPPAKPLLSGQPESVSAQTIQVSLVRMGHPLVVGL